MANDFSKGSVRRAILMQSGPLLIAQLIQLLYNVVDRVYIGRIPGVQGAALTGVGIVFPVISLITAFTDWFGVGGAPLFSIARGAGDRERARRLLGTTAWLLLWGSILITLLGILFVQPILYLFGASDATYPYAADYLRIYILGTVFFMCSSGLNYFINAQGFPKFGMMTTLLGAALNIVLDPILIFGMGWGVRGAAIATVLSQTVSAVWVFRFLLSGRADYRLECTLIRGDRRLLREILTLGFSGFIMKATNSLVQVVCNVQLRRFGGDLYVGIITIINSIRSIIELPLMTVTHGSQPVLAYQYGAKSFRRLRQGIAFQFLCGILYSLLVWLAVLLFPRFFVGIFTNSTEMLTHGVEAVRIYFASFIFMVGQSGSQTVFVSLGKSRRAIFFSMLRKVVIVVPLTLLLPCFMGVNGVFAAEPVSNLLGGSAAFLTMYFTVYRKLPRAEGQMEHRI
ncbi:MATE family efflux transporter [Oribacterium sp. oral taxon 102]|uniref:MATE family efflux transporter n=1 Tax=Oribacterium sp. oral taxon 102 TaxID=671214 RepID=UPI0015BC2EED|nr:MATE family efflux transporter [Oribacterium sp. oral taxon 102]NWO20375.1 MATE family efflux transporter [Oribacterium sp. oral taxon 102]